MRVEAKHSHGQIALEITAENANDRALFGLFDDHNNKNGFPNRRIACTSTYSCDHSAVTSLYLYGMDMKPLPPTPIAPNEEAANMIWNAAIEAAVRCADKNGEGCTQDIGSIISKLKR